MNDKCMNPSIVSYCAENVGEKTIVRANINFNFDVQHLNFNEYKSIINDLRFKHTFKLNYDDK